MSVLLNRLVSLLMRRRPVETEEERLVRLAAEIMPTPEQLRELWTKLPPSTIHYDDEEEQPF